MIVPMRRIEIVMPRSRTDAVLRSLHRAGSVHLTPFAPRSALTTSVFGAPPPGSDQRFVEDLLAEVTALAGSLDGVRPQVSSVRELWSLDLAALGRRIDALTPVRSRVNELLALHARLAAESSHLAVYRRIVEALRPVVARFPTLPGYGSTAIIVNARYRGVLGLVRSELEAMTDGRCELVASELSGERVAALLVYPLAVADQVRLLLGGRDLEELTLPEDLAGLPFPRLVDRLTDREHRADAQRREVDRELDRLRDRHGATVAALQLVLQDRVAEQRALSAAGMSDHLALLSGWVPAAQVDALRERLAAEVGPEACLDVVPSDRHDTDEPPVAIQNPPLLQAFAPLASFVSLPRYGTIDPTPTLAASFPIFVGLMVGDVAYGVALLGLLLLARWRWPTSAWVRTLTPVVVLAGLSTVAFGILFGEFLGGLGQQLFGLQPVLFDRTEAVTTFLVIAVGIGAGQVALGLLLGIVNAALLQHGHELVARIGLLAVLAATGVLLAGLMGFMPLTAAHVATAGLVVAVAVLIASLGLAGPIEAMGVLGNVLSYARLMAIGMASVMLALVANRLAGLAGNLVVGLLIATLLHGVNVVLGFFDATVQGLRLHYVEFFTKFVEPGGTAYQPFACVLDRFGAEGAPLPAALH